MTKERILQKKPFADKQIDRICYQIEYVTKGNNKIVCRMEEKLLHMEAWRDRKKCRLTKVNIVNKS